MCRCCKRAVILFTLGVGMGCAGGRGSCRAADNSARNGSAGASPSQPWPSQTVLGRAVVCGAVLAVAILCLAPPMALSAANDFRRGIQGSIQEIESQLRGDLSSEEEAALLWDLAGRARLIGDMVRARYALSRLRESPVWATFSHRLDALLQAALLHESQARFGPAAEIYGEIVQEELPRPAPITLESTYVGYALRWAGCLEKAGDNRRAAEIYGDLLKNLPRQQQPKVLVRLIHNYRYGRPSSEAIEGLAEQVRAVGDSGMLWQLGQMYAAKGMFKQAAELFAELWPRQPSLAVHYLDDMLVAFARTGRLEALLEDAESRSSDRGVARFLASAYQRLGKSNKALEIIIRCQAAVANALVARLATLSATARASMPSDPRDLTPELNILEYQALQGVGSVTAAAKLARAMCRRRPRDFEWYEAAGRLPGTDVVSLWRSYVEAHERRGAAYQRAARSLAELGYATQSLSFLKEGTRVTPGLANVLAYADALISAGSLEGAWRQYRDIRARKWVADEFLTRHVTGILGDSAARDGVRRLLEPHLTRPPQVLWEDQILRNLLAENGETDRLLDWVSLDSSSLAAVRLAQWALFEGRSHLSLAAYERVPEESLYREIARIEMARILRDTGAEDVKTLRRIGDLLDPTVKKLSIKPDEPASTKRNNLEILGLWARVKLSAGEGLQVLRRMYELFGEERESIVQQYEGSEADLIILLRGLSLSQVGSLSDAVSEFRAVSGTKLAAEAAFYEARALFWQEEFAEAESVFDRIVTDPGAWRLANDGLQYLSFLRSLSLGSLQLLSRATFLVWQGRWNDAVPIFRDLSVREYGQDVGEWARYRIGKVLWDAGEIESAVAEWDRLSRDGRYGWLRDRLTWELVSGYPGSASAEAQREELLREIISSGHDTLFGDLARLRLRLDGQTSVFPSERPGGDV